MVWWGWLAVSLACWAVLIVLFVRIWACLPHNRDPWEGPGAGAHDQREVVAGKPAPGVFVCHDPEADWIADQRRELETRLRSAVDPHSAVDIDEHVANIAGELERVRKVRPNGS